MKWMTPIAPAPSSRHFSLPIMTNVMPLDLGGFMRANIIALIALPVSFVSSPISLAEPLGPVVSRKGEVYELKLPVTVREALTNFNSRFQHWEATDYALEVRHGGHQEKLKNRAPYALVTDVNGDGKDDLILDGHDHQRTLLIGVVSKGSQYRVSIIRESELVDPQTLECQFDGKQQRGFAYYLWLPEKKKPGSPIFSLAWPQQSNASGKLLNDGGTVDYYFKEGQFEEGESIPL
ncbi:MAG: hypothetical protein JJE04_21855 [Acidobacteriia bacterium]|nr:hypothetical protein [Terriglobia bacterium]